MRKLRELGYVEGKNISFEYRSADDKLDRLPALVGELVRLNVDALVTSTTPGAIAAKNATKTIPVVMAAIGDPIGSGVVPNLARPGGNITGFTSIVSDLEVKRLEVLKEMRDTEFNSPIDVSKAIGEIKQQP